MGLRERVWGEGTGVFDPWPPPPKTDEQLQRRQ